MVRRKTKFLAACWLAGWKHRGEYARRLISEKLLVPGSFLTLRPEPENPHDPNAIAVYGGTTHLGYIPRKWNKQVHKLIEFYGLENIRALYQGNARIHIVKLNK